MKLAWWHWLLAAFMLFGIELLFPSFTIAWIGISAFMVSVVILLAPGLTHWLQFLLWAASSLLFSSLWYKYLKPKGFFSLPVRKDGLVGRLGTVVQGAEPYERGVVEIAITDVCVEEFPCVGTEPVKQGDRVRIVAQEGELLRIRRVGNSRLVK